VGLSRGRLERWFGVGYLGVVGTFPAEFLGYGLVYGVSLVGGERTPRAASPSVAVVDFLGGMFLDEVLLKCCC